jgi:radical SAM superfamily enzyme YgiQ (UPF0313 family)
MKNNVLFGRNASSFQVFTQLAWSSKELSLIGKWLKQTYNVPFLIGGAWVTGIKNGNLKDLDSNCYIVPGRAELYVENLTAQLAVDKKVQPEYVNNNSVYDNHQYKFSKMHWKKYDFIDPDDWLPLEVSRGCAFNCAYCEFDRKSTVDSYKNPEVLLQELLYNYEHFGVTRYMLLDDLYNDSKHKVRELHDKVWSKLPFRAEWISYLRLDMVWADPESAEILQASGARLGSFGIETLHNKAGKKVGKGLGRDRILKTLEHLRDTWGDDTLVFGLFILGLPFEPRESLHNTMEWAKDTDLLFGYSFAPLWINPPSDFELAINPNNISKDNDKYQINWLDRDNWINSEGITFKEADQMSQWINNPDKSLGLQIGGGTYPELRTAGLSHRDILKINSDPKSMIERVIKANLNKNQKTDDRMLKVLQLSGI